MTWRDGLSEWSRSALRKQNHPEWVAPMLATLTREPFSDAEWIYERKLDGQRLLAFRRSSRIRLMSRNKKSNTARYPEIVDALKRLASDDFVIDGFTDPQGSRVGIGALLIGFYRDGDLRFAGKVGTGYDAETLLRLRRRLSALERKSPPFVDSGLPSRHVHWVAPSLVAEVGFTEWTKDDKLRHPRFIGLRDDKNPSEVVKAFSSHESVAGDGQA